QAPGDGFKCRMSGMPVHLYLPGEQSIRMDGAADDMRIRDRRVLTALAIAGGPRNGAGTARPDSQHAAIIEPDDAAAPGAHRDDIQYRRTNGQSVYLGLRRQLRLRLAHQRHVSTGAAHVE